MTRRAARGGVGGDFRKEKISVTGYNLKMFIFKDSPERKKISSLNREIRAISREIRHLDRNLRKMEKAAGPPIPILKKKPSKDSFSEAETRKRFASYLSTGSFQTISQHKFRSDIVRRRRIMVSVLILILLAAAYLIWKVVV